MTIKNDDQPPTTGPEDESPPTDAPPAEPPAQQTAEEEGEKVPEWGKTLMSQVESLTAAVTSGANPPVPDAPSIDENPSPKPWHLKGGK
jgi:hypothetical protein